MKTYRLGINISGSIVSVLEVSAVTPRKAKREWARLTGHLDPTWNDKEGAYFGFPIVETDIPALQRKEVHGLYMY